MTDKKQPPARIPGRRPSCFWVRWRCASARPRKERRRARILIWLGPDAHHAQAVAVAQAQGVRVACVSGQRKEPFRRLIGNDRFERQETAAGRDSGQGERVHAQRLGKVGARFAFSGIGVEHAPRHPLPAAAGHFHGQKTAPAKERFPGRSVVGLHRDEEGAVRFIGAVFALHPVDVFDRVGRFRLRQGRVVIDGRERMDGQNDALNERKKDPCRAQQEIFLPPAPQYVLTNITLDGARPTPQTDGGGCQHHGGVYEEEQPSQDSAAHQVKAVAAQPHDGVQQQVKRGEPRPCQRLPSAAAAHVGLRRPVLYLLRRPRRVLEYVYVLAGTGQAPALRFAALKKRRQPRVACATTR